jgi:hypothetical protein
MNYAKVGPLCNAVSKLAATKGFGSAKLMVKEWKDDKIKLQLVCFKEKLRCVRHTLSNEDVVYEAVEIDAVPNDTVYELKVDVTYDRFKHTYKENYSNLSSRVFELVEGVDPVYNELNKVFMSHELRELLLYKEDLQRSVNLNTAHINLIKRQIEYITTEAESVAGIENSDRCLSNKISEVDLDKMVNSYLDIVNDLPFTKSFSVKKFRKFDIDEKEDCECGLNLLIHKKS